MELPAAGLLWFRKILSVRFLIWGESGHKYEIQNRIAKTGNIRYDGSVRDLFYDLTNWEDTPEHRWQLALDLVAMLPLIGALKNAGKAGELAQEVLRHGDDISDVLNALPSGADEAAELIGDLAKHSDEAGELAQDALKYGDEIDKIISEVFDEEDELWRSPRNIPDDDYDWLADVTEDAGDASFYFKDEQLRTKPNTAYFWSGNSNGIGGKDFAMDHAAKNGGTTLESLMKSQGIEMPTWDIADQSSIKVWEYASGKYAGQVSGDVHALIGTTQRQNSVWQSIELPALTKNPYVSKIILIDPETLTETIIFRR